MDYEFDDITSTDQVSEDFAFDYGESFDSDLTIEEIDTPIKELKVIILSIDWEITSEILAKYQQEIQNLEKLWSKDNIALAFLRILGALGIYIKICQAKAHPDAVKLLYSVYNGLEKTIISTEMSSADKVALVQSELSKYNAIRDIIKQANTLAAKGRSPSVGDAALQGENASSTNQDKKPIESSLEVDKETSLDLQDEKIVPALSAVPRSTDEKSSRQWSSQETEHDGDIAGRLTEFFGDDDTVETKSDDGVVPLSTSIEETPLVTSYEPDEQEESLVETASNPESQEEETSQRLDSFFGDDEPVATEPQIEVNDGVVPLPNPSIQGETTISGDEEANIFDDLFANKPTTSADDLLLQMHLPNDKKSTIAEQKAQKTASDTIGSETLTLVDQPVHENNFTSQDGELNNRLDSFFRDDEEPTVSGSQTEGSDGVVPLPSPPTKHQIIPNVSEKASEADNELRSTTRDESDKLTAILRLKEIIEWIDTSISHGECVDFLASIVTAKEQLADNKVALMLLETLGSSFIGLKESNRVCSEGITRLKGLCDLLAEVSETITLPNTELTVAVCDEIRKYITFQDTIIYPLLGNNAESMASSAVLNGEDD